MNYDRLEDRRIIEKEAWLESPDLLILDELHKMPAWKNHIKGVYDTSKKSMRILVTGSARLDAFRQSGDALSGRFFLHRLLPFSLSELEGTSLKGRLDLLMERGGFPEPLLAEEAVDADRWRLLYVDGLIRSDVLDFERIHDVAAMQTVLRLLRRSVGSTISYASIARDVELSPHTVKKYIEILETLFSVFRVVPHSRNVARSLVKEPKIYFYDSGLVAAEGGTKFENLVALSLLKHARARADEKGERGDSVRAAEQRSTRRPKRAMVLLAIHAARRAMNTRLTSTWTLVALALGLTACSGAWYPGAIDRPLKPGDRIADGRRHIRFDLRGHHGQKVDLSLSAGETSCRVHGRLDGDIHERGRDGRLQVQRACVLVGPFDQRPNRDLRLRGEVWTADGSRTEVDWRRNNASLEDVYDSSIVIDAAGKATVVIALACPWVYAWDGRRWQRRVEIIQQLVGREARRPQRVALGAVAVIDGRVRLRLVEAKPEISRLDRLVLIAAGRTLAPVGRPELARIDGRDLVLEQGDREVVEFRLYPPGTAHPPRIHASLEATGHYEPAW